MKVLITAKEAYLNGPVDEHFGRGVYFCLYDTDTKEITFIENEAAKENSGAGVKAGQLALSLGAEMVVTGHLGPKASAVLEKGKIRGYALKSATIASTIDDVEAGTLSPLQEG